jgi:galacturan 1,4-alpha-galacturonidase
MKSSKNSSVLVFVFFLVIMIFVKFCLISVEARKHHIRKTKPRKGGNGGDTRGSNFTAPSPAPLPDYGSYPTSSTIFDVLSFGAKGDGVSDDSKVNENRKVYL